MFGQAEQRGRSCYLHLNCAYRIDQSCLTSKHERQELKPSKTVVTMAVQPAIAKLTFALLFTTAPISVSSQGFV